MEPTVLSNEKGMTLVEVMVALVVFLLVSLAMMQTALVGIDSNMVNVLRDEAVGIAEMRMNDARNLAFTQAIDTLVSDGVDSNLSSTICPASFVSSFGTNGQRIQKALRSISAFNYCSNMTVTGIDFNNKQVTVTVGWKWKGQDYAHTVSTVRRRES